MDLPLSSWCELVHFQRLNFALSLETNLRASVELCRPRTWSVESRDFGRPSSALDEVSPKSAVREEADQARVVRSIGAADSRDRGR